MLDPHAIHVYTDGSCYKNPGGKSGCAAVVEYPDHLQRDEEQIFDFGCSESSINRMELLACIRALQWIRQHAPWDGITRVQILTDSQYVTSNLYRAREWKKNGYKVRFQRQPTLPSDCGDHRRSCCPVHRSNDIGSTIRRAQ